MPSEMFRAALVSHITRFPGLTSYELARVLKSTRGQVQRTLMGLVADGKIRADRQRRSDEDPRLCWRWYPPGPDGGDRARVLTGTGGR